MLRLIEIKQKIADKVILPYTIDLNRVLAIHRTFTNHGTLIETKVYTYGSNRPMTIDGHWDELIDAHVEGDGVIVMKEEYLGSEYMGRQGGFDYRVTCNLNKIIAVKKFRDRGCQVIFEGGTSIGYQLPYETMKKAWELGRLPKEENV